MLFPHILNLALATGTLSVALTLQLPDYRALKTSLNSSVLEVTFHNPDSPIVNLWSQDTQDDLTDLVQRLRDDNENKVVIFNSDVPRFFVAHVDNAILAGPNTNFIYSFATLLYNITTLAQVTIGAIEGRARGAGSELLSALDMRFATRTDSLIAQPELAVGLTPGGGGSQFLTNLIGRGRAMEYILAAKDITACEAERIGWVNKSFETSADMYAYIDQLTSRLRLFPLTGLHEAKKSINRASVPTSEDINAEAVGFYKQMADPLVQQAMQRMAVVLGNKSLLEVELNLTDRAPAFYQ